MVLTVMDDDSDGDGDDDDDDDPVDDDGDDDDDDAGLGRMMLITMTTVNVHSSTSHTKIVHNASGSHPAKPTDSQHHPRTSGLHLRSPHIRRKPRQRTCHRVRAVSVSD